MPFRLLDAGAATGLMLSESYATYPTAAVLGSYFAHPEGHDFGVGRIEQDQVEDCAAQWVERRGGGAEADNYDT